MAAPWRVRAGQWLLACVLVAIASTTWGADAARSWARWRSASFQNITVPEGLPHPTATAFAQDRGGLMWIGTFGGLARYDGYRMQVFRQSPDGLPDNYIRAMQAADDGSLVLGTTSGGLARLDPRDNHFQRYDTSHRSGTGTRIYTLSPDRGGGFWVGGLEGLSHLLPGLNRIERIAPDAGLPQRNEGHVYAVVEDRHGALWVGTEHGLYRRAAGATGFVQVGDAQGPARAVLARDIWALYEDRAGNLWVGSGADGVAIVAPDGAVRIPSGLDGSADAIQHRTVRDFIQTSDGRVWIATDGVGVLAYEPASGRIDTLRHDPARPDSLASNTTRSLYLDRSGGLWVATEAAASRYDTRPSIVFPLDATAMFGADAARMDPNVRSIHTDAGGRVWLGFNRGRLAAIDLTGGHIDTLTLGGMQTDQDVRVIHETADGRIIVGSRGLVTIDPATLKVSPYPLDALGERPVLALERDGADLLVGSYDGLYRVDPSHRAQWYRHDAADPHSLADNQVRNIERMPDGDLWFATSNGLSILHPGAQSFDNLRNVPGDATSLPQNYTGSIVRLGDTVWVGTYGGLAQTRLGHGEHYRFRTIGTPQGLNNDNVASVLPDHRGRLWTVTSDGICVYDPHDGSVRTLGLRDGLASGFYNHRTAALGPSGELLLGGMRGLVVLNPDADTAGSADNAPLAVTSMDVDQRALPFDHLPTPTHSLQLDRPPHTLDIRFALLDYTASNEVRYSYRLEGFDERWIAVDPDVRPAATYTNLPGGQYRLWLRATVPGLHARTVETRLPLSIPQRWFERRWVHVLLGVLLILLVLMVVQLRTRYLRHRANQLSALVHARTSALQEANDRLDRLASTDELTGLLNRRALLLRLEEACAAADLDGAPLSILMLDLDSFKLLNDTHGHLAGDAVLREVAGLVAGCCRQRDHIGRYGGEEILVVLTGANLEVAEPVAARIRRTVARTPVHHDEQLMHVTASIGVATRRPGERVPALIARADAALYRAKHAGRNTVVLEQA